jgi:hypothetical protein
MRLPMNEALNATIVAIEARVRLYRSTVMLVAAILVLSGLAAAVFRSWGPLSAVILIAPVSGAFCAFDNRRVRNWRRQILELHAAHDLDLTGFAKAISAHPMVPRRTIEGMLASLPTMNVDSRLVPRNRGNEASERR